MGFRYILALSAFLASLGLAALGAEIPAQDVLSLNIKDAVKMALERNPDVATGRERLVEADKNISFSVSQLFPNVSFSGNVAREKAPITGVGSALFGGEPYNSYLAQLKLSQPLYAGGSLTSGLAVARLNKDIREKDLEISERDLSVLVLEAFYTILTNREVVDLLKRTKAVDEQSLATSERYFRIGRAQLIDVLQAKTQLALVLPQIANAENQMKIAGSQLVTILHESQTRTLALTGSLGYLDPEKVRSLLAKRRRLAEITRGELQIAQSQKQADVQLAGNYPQLSFQTFWGRQTYTSSDLLGNYANTWSFGLQLQIPLFSGLSSVFQRGALASQTAQIEIAQSKLLDQLAFNQVQGEGNLDTAVLVLKSSKQAAEYARASLVEAQKDFRLQTINFLQLLTSEQSFLNAELSYAQARYGYVDTVAKYFVASGIPISLLVEILGNS